MYNKYARVEVIRKLVNTTVVLSVCLSKDEIANFVIINIETIMLWAKGVLDFNEAESYEEPVEVE